MPTETQQAGASSGLLYFCCLASGWGEANRSVYTAAERRARPGPTAPETTMRVATLLGEDPTRFTARLDATDTLARWSALEPALARMDSVQGVREALQPGSDPALWDSLMGALLRLAAHDGGDDADAVLLVLHLVDLGSRRLRQRFPADLVLGQLTICIRAFPWRTRTRAYAANLLHDTEKALCRELRPNWARHRRDEDQLVDPTQRASDSGLHPLDRVALQTPDQDDLDMVDLLLWARRTEVVDPRDLAMLLDYFTARTDGIIAGHDHVARLHGVTARTSRRRCAAALQALRTAGPAYLAA
jgi:hypothetical protein